MAVVKDEIQLHFEGGTRVAVEGALQKGEFGGNVGAELEGVYRRKDNGTFLHYLSEERMAADPSGVQALMGGPFLPQAGSLAGTGKRNIVVNSAGAISLLGDDVIYADDYNGGVQNAATLNLALTAIGSTKKRLILKGGSWAVNANVTIPANVHLSFWQGAILTVSAGITLTLQGYFEGGEVQYFSGAGTVVFAAGVVEQVEASWFGPAEDGVTDAYAALQAGITAAATIGRFHSKKTSYYISSFLSLNSNVEYDFGWATIYTTTPTDGSLATGGWVRGQDVENVIVKRLMMHENNHNFPDSGSIQGLRFIGGSRIFVQNCIIEYYNESQIRMSSVNGFLVSGCETRYSTFRGIYVSGGAGEVSNCEAHHNTFHGLYIGDGGVFHFRNNHSHDNTQYGFYMSTTGDSMNSNVLVEGNRFINNVGGGIVPDYHIGHLAIRKNTIRSIYTQDSIIIMRDSPLGWYGGGSIDIIGNTMDGKIQAWNLKQGKILENTCLWIEGRGFRNVDIEDNTLTLQGVTLNGAGYTEPDSTAFDGAALVYGKTSHSLGQFFGYNQALKRWFIKRVDTLKVVMEAAGYNNLSASDIGKVFYKSFPTNGFADGGNYGYILDYDNATRSVYVWMTFAEPKATNIYSINAGTAGDYTVNHIERIHPEFAAAETLKIVNPNDGQLLAGAGVISAVNHYNDIGIFIISGDATALESSNVNIRNNLITDGARCGIFIGTVKGYCNIEGNRIENIALGASSGTSWGIEVSGDGNPIDRVHVIKNNVVKNVLTGGIRVNTGKWVAYGNRCDNSTVISVGTSGQVAAASIGDNDFYYGSATPSAGTWKNGDRQFSLDVSGGIGDWACTASGTFGTLGAVSGDTTNGSGVISNCSGEDLLLVGQYITLSTGFAAGPKLILAIDTIAHTITVDANATSSTVGSVVSWAVPTFTTFGRKFNLDITRTSANVGGINEVICENTDSSSTASGAKFHARTTGDAGGNPQFHAEIPGFGSFSFGLDNAKTNNPGILSYSSLLTAGIIAEFYPAANGGAKWKMRNQDAAGANVGSANDLTLGTAGNYFKITGTTTINGIASANWQPGALICLEFAGACTVKNNTAASAGFLSIITKTAADVVEAANKTMSLRLNDAGTLWLEV